MNMVVSLLLRFLSLYLLFTASLYTIAFCGLSTAAFLARLLLAYLALTLCALYGVLASLVLRLFAAHHSAQWATARAFKHTMALLTGVRFEILSGSSHLETRPAVFVGNHQTALDVLLLGTIFPKHCSVTAKKSLKRAPFLGWFMSLSGTVFIDRADRKTALKAFEGAAMEMKRRKQSVFIFPEGTRSNAEEPMLLPFKKGAFHLAIQAGVPIVPVVTGCYWGILGARQRRFRAGRIPVVVLPPIPTSHLTPADVEDLTRHTRDTMLAALIKLTESPRGQRAARPDLEPITTPAPPSANVNGATDTNKIVENASGTDDLRRSVTTRAMERRAKEDGLME